MARYYDPDADADNDEPPDDGSPTYDEQQEYIDEWRRILKGVLNWSDRRFDEWLVRREGLLNSVWLTHDYPSYWVATVLIPTDLRERLRGEAIILRNRIDEVLHTIHDEPSPDWAAAKAAIRAILSEYGADLAEERDGPPPSPAQP